MRAVLIDDEGPALGYLELQCAQVPDLEVVGRFRSAHDALSYLLEHRVELVITDIEMPGLSGLDAVDALRAIQPWLGVIFVTGYEEFALKAFSLDAVAYLMKPCHIEALQRAVKKAARLLPKGNRVQFRTFGPFTMLVDGVPYRFSNAKAKELLAVLVDRRGGVVTMEQAALLLWEERPYDKLVKQLYRKLTSYLHQVCRAVGEDFIEVGRGTCNLLPQRVDCDYFRLLEGDLEAVQSYNGIYMSEYSWAEYTVGKLDRLAQFSENPASAADEYRF